jgi:hypothetical protein
MLVSSLMCLVPNFGIRKSIHSLDSAFPTKAESTKQEAENRKQEAGSRKQEAGSRKQEAGSRKQEAGF